jgi:hypothetical protein
MAKHRAPAGHQQEGKLDSRDWQSVGKEKPQGRRQLRRTEGSVAEAERLRPEAAVSNKVSVLGTYHTKSMRQRTYAPGVGVDWAD